MAGSGPAMRCGPMWSGAMPASSRGHSTVDLLRVQPSLPSPGRVVYADLGDAVTSRQQRRRPRPPTPAPCFFNALFGVWVNPGALTAGCPACGGRFRGQQGFLGWC